MQKKDRMSIWLYSTRQKKCRPRNFDYVTERENPLNNAKNFYDGREMIISTFKDKIFALHAEYGYFEDDGVHRGDENEDADDLDDLNETITKNDKIIDKKLFKRYFGDNSLAEMQADLYITEDTSNKTTADMIRDKLNNF